MNANATNDLTQLREESLRCVPGLLELIAQTSGNPKLWIGLLDGLVNTGHEVLEASNVRQEVLWSDWTEDFTASAHATFIASMLVGQRNLGICAGCTLLSVPVVDKKFMQHRLSPAKAAMRIATAIKHAVSEGADVLLLSLEFAPERSQGFRLVAETLAWALKRGVRSVIAAGNRSIMAGSSLLAAAGVVPVAMARADGTLHKLSTRGITIGARGLLAPGETLAGAELPTGIGRRTGTSYAVAVVSGTFALLRCCFQSLPPNMIWNALLNPMARLPGRAVVPPLLSVKASLEHLHRERESL